MALKLLFVVGFLLLTDIEVTVGILGFGKERVKKLPKPLDRSKKIKVDDSTKTQLDDFLIKEHANLSCNRAQEDEFYGRLEAGYQIDNDTFGMKEAGLKDLIKDFRLKDAKICNRFKELTCESTIEVDEKTKTKNLAYKCFCARMDRVWDGSTGRCAGTWKSGCRMIVDPNREVVVERGKNVASKTSGVRTHLDINEKMTCAAPMKCSGFYGQCRCGAEETVGERIKVDEDFRDGCPKEPPKTKDTVLRLLKEAYTAKSPLESNFFIPNGNICFTEHGADLHVNLNVSDTNAYPQFDLPKLLTNIWNEGNKGQYCNFFLDQRCDTDKKNSSRASCACLSDHKIEYGSKVGAECRGRSGAVCSRYFKYEGKWHELTMGQVREEERKDEGIGSRGCLTKFVCTLAKDHVNKVCCELGVEQGEVSMKSRCYDRMSFRSFEGMQSDAVKDLDK